MYKKLENVNISPFLLGKNTIMQKVSKTKWKQFNYLFVNGLLNWKKVNSHCWGKRCWEKKKRKDKFSKTWSQFITVGYFPLTWLLVACFFFYGLWVHAFIDWIYSLIQYQNAKILKLWPSGSAIWIFLDLIFSCVSLCIMYLYFCIVLFIPPGWGCLKFL